MAIQHIAETVPECYYKFNGNGTGNITENASNANPKTIEQKNGGKK